MFSKKKKVDVIFEYLGEEETKTSGKIFSVDIKTIPTKGDTILYNHEIYSVVGRAIRYYDEREEIRIYLDK